MIIEGLPSVLLGILAFFLLPNDLESAYFLNEKEKSVLLARHSRDYGMTKSAMAFSTSDMKKAFGDWKVWVFCIAQFGADTMLYGGYIHFPILSFRRKLTVCLLSPRVLDILANNHQGSWRLDDG